MTAICTENSTKKWNKFDLWSMLFAGLPRAVNSRHESIHFICCSNQASAIEMADPIVDELLKLETEGLVTYDARLGQEVLVIAPVLCAICDNPRASEITNHTGSSSKKYYTICQVKVFYFPSDIHYNYTHISLSICSVISSIIQADLEQRDLKIRPLSSLESSSDSQLRKRERRRGPNMEYMKSTTLSSGFQLTYSGVLYSSNLKGNINSATT